MFHPANPVKLRAKKTTAFQCAAVSNGQSALKHTSTVSLCTQKTVLLYLVERCANMPALLCASEIEPS